MYPISFLISLWRKGLRSFPRLGVALADSCPQHTSFSLSRNYLVSSVCSRWMHIRGNHKQRTCYLKTFVYSEKGSGVWAWLVFCVRGGYSFILPLFSSASFSLLLLTHFFPSISGGICADWSSLRQAPALLLRRGAARCWERQRMREKNRNL